MRLFVDPCIRQWEKQKYCIEDTLKKMFEGKYIDTKFYSMDTTIVKISENGDKHFVNCLKAETSYIVVEYSREVDCIAYFIV